MNKLVEWFDKTEGLHPSWFAKIVYESQGGLCAKIFTKSECEGGTESYFRGFSDALNSLGLSYVSQMKGYGLWFFPKGGATAGKIREASAEAEKAPSKPSLKSVVEERAQSYGSFTLNMKRVSALIHYIGLKGNPNGFQKDTFEFAKYMLALKAVRSLTAKGEVYNDCIIDFINYLNLVREEVFKGEVDFDFLWIFNPKLTKYGKITEEEAKEITWLIKDTGQLPSE